MKIKMNTAMLNTEYYNIANNISAVTLLDNMPVSEVYVGRLSIWINGDEPYTDRPVFSYWVGSVDDFEVALRFLITEGV